MERDVNDIKLHFNHKFRITPSNTDIMKLLLKTYKESQVTVQRKPKSYKKKFEITF